MQADGARLPRTWIGGSLLHVNLSVDLFSLSRLIKREAEGLQSLALLPEEEACMIGMTVYEQIELRQV